MCQEVAKRAGFGLAITDAGQAIRSGLFRRPAPQGRGRARNRVSPALNGSSRARFSRGAVGCRWWPGKENCLKKLRILPRPGFVG